MSSFGGNNRKITDNISKSNVSTLSKFKGAPGIGDVFEQLTKKPPFKPETTKFVSQNNEQFLVQQQGRAQEKMDFHIFSTDAQTENGNLYTSDPETDSLISQNSMADFDQPFYSKNDVTKKTLKQYEPLHTQAPCLVTGVQTEAHPFSFHQTPSSAMQSTNQKQQLYHEEIEVFGWISQMPPGS